ncbi:hypothetical protein [Profundibacter sp.]
MIESMWLFCHDGLNQTNIAGHSGELFARGQGDAGGVMAVAAGFEN